MLYKQKIYGIIALVVLISLASSPALGQRRGKGPCPPESGGECGEGLPCRAYCPSGWVLHNNLSPEGWNKKCVCKKKPRAEEGQCQLEEGEKIKCERYEEYGKWTPKMLDAEVKKCEEELNAETEIRYIACKVRARKAAETCLEKYPDRKTFCDSLLESRTEDCKEDKAAEEIENKARCKRIWLTDHTNAGFCQSYDYPGMEEDDPFYDAQDGKTCTQSDHTNDFVSTEEQNFDDFSAFE